MSTPSKIYLNFLLTKDTIKEDQDISISISDLSEWIDLYSSQIAFNQKDYSKSKEHAVKVVQNPNSSSNLLVAESYNLFGRIARLYKLDNDAKAFYDSAILNFTKDSSFFGEFGIVRLGFNQANILLLSSELSKAEKAYDELLTKLEVLKPEKELHQEFDRLKLKIYQNKALTFLYDGKVQESKDSFEKALSFASSVSGSSTEADLYLNYSNLAIIQEDFNLAYELLSKAGILYKRLDKIDIFSKVEIDKIKINLINDIDQLIDPFLISHLIQYYQQAKKTKEVNLRVIEIFEILYNRGMVPEAVELRDFLLDQNFLPDLKGRVLYISMGLFIVEENFDKVFKLGDEAFDLVNQLKDTDAILPLTLLINKANYMLNKDSTQLIKSLKDGVNQILKMKDYRTAIGV